MRTPFTLACMCIAAQTYAFDWDMVKHSLLSASLGENYETHPIYEFHGSNRATARQRMAKHGDRHVPELSRQHRIKAIDAHHNLMARRERLGLAKVGMATPEVGQEYSELNSISGFMLNVLQGMSYQQGGNSKCYDASEDIIIAIDTSSDLIKKFYIPAIWAEMMVQAQDITALTAAFYVDCSVNKFFNQVSHLFTEEGTSEVTGRVAGAYFFEIAAAQKVWNNPDDYTSKEKGQAYGRAFSVVANYYL